MESVEKKQCKCGQCEEIFDVVIYHKISEEQQDALESMSLFQWKCPKCGHVYRFIYPCYFINHKEHYILRYVNGQSNWQQELPLAGYEKRECNSLEEMAEKSRIFREKLDDQVMELLKLVIFAKLSTEENEISRIYFYRKSKDGMLEFTLFYGEEPDGISVPITMYQEIMELAADLPALSEDTFHCIDGEWAGKVVAEDNR